MGISRNIVKTFFVAILSLSAIMYFSPGYASMADEKLVEGLIETYGKDNVVKVILEKRDWKITIQKNRTFGDSYGKPDLSFITPKSIIYDLKLLNLSINDFSSALDEQQKQQAILNEEDEKASTVSTSSQNSIPLSTELNHKIELKREEYNNSTSHSERRRLKKELSILQTAYNKARNNEKSKLRVYYPDKVTKKNYSYNSSGCKRAKAKLQEITDPVYRHRIFFCSDRQYRKENPSLCEEYRYGTEYDLKKYKKEVIRLREQVSESCKS